MRVAVDAYGATREFVFLCVQRVAVVHLDAVVLIEKETVTPQHAAAIGSALFHTIAVG